MAGLPRTLWTATGFFAGLAVLFVFVGYVSVLPFFAVVAICVAAIIFGKGWVQNVAISVASLFFALGAIEAVAHYLEPKLQTETSLNEYVPRLTIGWGPARPGPYKSVRIVDGKVIYDVTITIDDRLLRKTVSGTSGKGVAIFGDSLIFGTGVEDKDTLPQQFADLTGRKYPVFNLGVGRYSPANMLAELQSGWADDLLAKTQLMVEFVAPWHAERSGCKSNFVRDAPSYAIVDGKLVFAGYCPRNPSGGEFFAIWRYLVQGRIRVVTNKDLDLFVAITKENIRLAREAYKQPIVIYYLRTPAYLKGLAWTDDEMMKAFRDAGAEVLDYTITEDHGRDPKYEISGDGHPTAFANAVRARRLADFVAKTYPQLATP